MAEALGCYAEYVEQPEDIRPALQRAWREVEEGTLSQPEALRAQVIDPASQTGRKTVSRACPPSATDIPARGKGRPEVLDPNCGLCHASRFSAVSST
jgi:hypothetical protein